MEFKSVVVVIILLSFLFGAIIYHFPWTKYVIYAGLFLFVILFLILGLLFESRRNDTPKSLSKIEKKQQE